MKTSTFAALALGYHLKRAGIDRFTVYEKAADLGGVWRENTYPGAACDIPSHLYSFSFAQNPECDCCCQKVPVQGALLMSPWRPHWLPCQ